MSVVNTRRNKIINILSHLGQAKVSDLAEQLDVSPVTIRRDLDYLEESNIVERSYGKASLVNRPEGNFNVADLKKKREIAMEAAHLIRDRSTILLNSSSTALLCLEYIEADHVTVVTNNCKALSLDLNPKLMMVLTGGELRYPKESLVGDFTIQNIRQVAADYALLGCSGVSPEAGISTEIMPEGSVNAAMLEQAKVKILLADSNKIGKVSNFKYGDAGQIDYLVTDARAPKSTLKQFNRMGIKILIAGESLNSPEL